MGFKFAIQLLSTLPIFLHFVLLHINISVGTMQSVWRNNYLYAEALIMSTLETARTSHKNHDQSFHAFFSDLPRTYILRTR